MTVEVVYEHHAIGRLFLLWKEQGFVAPPIDNGELKICKSQCGKTINPPKKNCIPTSPSSAWPVSVYWPLLMMARCQHVKPIAGLRVPNKIHTICCIFSVRYASGFRVRFSELLRRIRLTCGNVALEFCLCNPSRHESNKITELQAITCIIGHPQIGRDERNDRKSLLRYIDLLAPDRSR